MQVAREATERTENCIKTKELYKDENWMRITQLCMLPLMKRRRAQSLRHGELEDGSENEVVITGYDHSDFEIPFFSGMFIIVCNNDTDARHSWRCCIADQILDITEAVRSSELQHYFTILLEGHLHKAMPSGESTQMNKCIRQSDAANSA